VLLVPAIFITIVILSQQRSSARRPTPTPPAAQPAQVSVEAVWAAGVGAGLSPDLLFWVQHIPAALLGQRAWPVA
jgi:hypothetical protein